MQRTKPIMEGVFPLVRCLRSPVLQLLVVLLLTATDTADDLAQKENVAQTRASSGVRAVLEG